MSSALFSCMHSRAQNKKVHIRLYCWRRKQKSVLEGPGNVHYDWFFFRFVLLLCQSSFL